MKDWLASFATPLSWVRLRALVIKESLQVLRDPSTLLIAFVLPPIMFFLFANAVSLDMKGLQFGVVLEGGGDASRSLAAAYSATPYFVTTQARDRRTLDAQLELGVIKGYVVIPADFDERQLGPASHSVLQVITDGSSPNTAAFVSNYAEGVMQSWQAGYESGSALNAAQVAVVTVEPRFWFNPELDSRRVLIPGAIAIVMTMIGTLLTALVVAREWERGTLEAMMSTPAGLLELLISKLAPYFVLGLLATLGCTALATMFYDVPLRGSYAALMLISAVFLVPALGQGLLISTLAKNQFVASQLAVFSGFMPAFLLSGFLYDIDSMPGWLQTFTQIIPARHYVASLQTVFLAGDLWPQFNRDMLAMLAIGVLFFGLTLAKSHRRLD
jgi:ABC-2 type transport system permease protein